MKSNYIFIPASVVCVAIVGSRLTDAGMEWYSTIALPSWTPAGAVIGTVWTVIFVLCTVSLLVFWNTAPRDRRFTSIALLFAINGLLNVGWSFLFFFLGLIAAALIEMLVLLATIIALIVLLFPRSRLAALLLIPYGAWVVFATILTTAVWTLNR